MIFVADAGPLISFARADRLELLHQVVGELWIPEAVYQELVTQGAGRPRAEEAREENGSDESPSRNRQWSARFPVHLEQANEKPSFSPKS